MKTLTIIILLLFTTVYTFGQTVKREPVNAFLFNGKQDTAFVQTTGADSIYGAKTFFSIITAAGDMLIKTAAPVLQFKDTDASAGDINASIQASATDTGDGTEDIDVQINQQIGGTLARWIFSDADQGIWLYPLGETANPVSITTGGAVDIPGDLTVTTIESMNILHPTTGVILGANAGNASITGAGDVGIGEYALNSLAGGQYNTAVGYYSVIGISAGAYNSLYGSSSGATINTGNYNALYATHSGDDITSGTYNSNFGYYSNSTANTSNTTSVGAFAGKYNVENSVFYVDALDRTNTAGDKAGALMYGTFNATPSSQTLTINGNTTITGTGAVTQPLTLGLSGGTSGQLSFVASDGDAGNIAINTSDQLIFSGFSGDYSFTDGNVYVSPIKGFYFDGGSHTFINESAADVLSVTVGGTEMATFTEAATNSIALNGNTTITPDGANTALTVDQNNDATALNVDSESTSTAAMTVFGKYAANITQDIADGRGLYVARNLNEAGSLPLANFINDHTSNTQPSIFVQQDGAGYGVSIDQNGNQRGINIDSESTSEPSIYSFGKYAARLTQDLSSGYGLRVDRDIAEVGSRPLLSFINDNATDTQATLSLQNDGSGTHITTGATNEDLEIDPNGSGETVVTGGLTSDNSFGELYDPSTVISTATANYYTLSGWTAGQVTSGTLDTDSTILVEQAGTYLINFSMSFTHATNNTVVHISAFNSTTNTEFINIETERKIGTGGDLGNVGGTGMVVLAANNKVCIRAKADNTGNLTINHGNFNLIRIK